MADLSELDVRNALSLTSAVSLTLWGEARNEPVEGQIAVANVIRHRRNTERWGNWKSVCLARLQFSCWWPEGGKVNHGRVLEMARRVVDAEEIAAEPWQQCVWIAEGMMAHRVRDNVRGATHYCTTTLLHTAPPAWAKGQAPVAVIGAHAFFAGIR